MATKFDIRHLVWIDVLGRYKGLIGIVLRWIYKPRIRRLLVAIEGQYDRGEVLDKEYAIYKKLIQKVI